MTMNKTFTSNNINFKMLRVIVIQQDILLIAEIEFHFEGRMWKTQK